MPRLRYADAFMSDAAQIQLPGKRGEMRSKTGLLADFPELGSREVPHYLRSAYGEGVRRLVANPFLVICEYDEPADEVRILGLIHRRATV